MYCISSGTWGNGWFVDMVRCDYVHLPCSLVCTDSDRVEKNWGTKLNVRFFHISQRMKCGRGTVAIEMSDFEKMNGMNDRDFLGCKLWAKQISRQTIWLSCPHASPDAAAPDRMVYTVMAISRYNGVGYWRRHIPLLGGIYTTAWTSILVSCASQMFITRYYIVLIIIAYAIDCYSWIDWVID